jgi:hypothetical protein
MWGRHSVLRSMPEFLVMLPVEGSWLGLQCVKLTHSFALPASMEGRCEKKCLTCLFCAKSESAACPDVLRQFVGKARDQDLCPKFCW